MPRRRFPAVDALRLALLVLSFSLNPSAWAEEGLEKRSFEVSGFSAVVLRIPAELFLTQDGTETLAAEAEPRVLARLTVDVRNGTLYIDADEGGFQTRRPIRLQLSVKALRHLQLDSSGDIQAGALRSETLRIVLQGSGTIEVKELVAETLRVELLGSGYVNVTEGRIREQAILLEGSGDYKASHLQSRRARVSLQGSGSAHLMASEYLRAEISGSGDIVYSGRPRLSESVTGAGAVVHSGEN